MAPRIDQDGIGTAQGFVDFLAHPDICRAYTGHYFARANMAHWLVIDHERLRRDWREVMSQLELPPRPRQAMQRAAAFSGYEEARARLLADACAMAQARDLLRADTAFYARWAA